MCFLYLSTEERNIWETKGGYREDITRIMWKKRGRNNRSKAMPRSCTHADNKCIMLLHSSTQKRSAAQSSTAGSIYLITERGIGNELSHGRKSGFFCYWYQGKIFICGHGRKEQEKDSRIHKEPVERGCNDWPGKPERVNWPVYGWAGNKGQKELRPLKRRPEK